MAPFLDEVRQERVAEVDRIAAHVELSLTELLEREDRLIGRLAEEADRGVEGLPAAPTAAQAGAAGNLKQAEDRHAALMTRRERRRQELERQRSLSLQAVERIASGMGDVAALAALSRSRAGPGPFFVVKTGSSPRHHDAVPGIPLPTSEPLSPVLLRPIVMALCGGGAAVPSRCGR